MSLANWLWFDLSLLLPLFVLILFLSKTKNKIVVGTTQILIHFILFLFLCILFCADFFYYQQTGKHIGFEVFTTNQVDTFSVITSFYLQETTLFYLFLTFCCLYTVLYYYKLHKITPRKTTSVLLGCSLLLITVAKVLPNLKNIENKDFNPIVSIFLDMRSKIIPSSFQLAENEFTQYIKISNPNPSHKQYPFMRQEAYPKFLAKNIILVVLESWSAKYVNQKVNGKKTTPYFESLSKRGLYFSRCYATGVRTVNGIVSILTGFPDIPGRGLFYSDYYQTRFSTPSKLLHSYGYKNLYITGGRHSSSKMAIALHNWGFDKVLVRHHFRRVTIKRPFVWGYDDKTIYEFALWQLSQSKVPFFLTVLTTSTHYPFQIPTKGKFTKEDSVEYQYLNALHFADKSIAYFMKQLEKRGLLQNTIFYFIADHTHHKGLTEYEDRRIPFLIYPMRKNSIDTEKPCSQIDFLTTLVHSLQINRPYASFGNDLLSQSQRNPFIFFTFGNTFGRIDTRLFYVDHLYANSQPRIQAIQEEEQSSYCQNATVCSSLQHSSLLYLNAYVNSIKQNKIYFPPD
ncbi:MAG: LTA synthase family protein [Spirochaetota bacterium]